MTGPDVPPVDVFFYGLFMDEALLRDKGLDPRARRLAFVEDFRLVIGPRAALVPCPGAVVHGVLFSLPRGEVDALYSEPSVSEYRLEVVSAHVAGDGVVQASCFNLPVPPSEDERNATYASQLRDLAGRIGLPPDYVSSLSFD